MVRLGLMVTAEKGLGRRGLWWRGFGDLDCGGGVGGRLGFTGTVKMGFGVWVSWRRGERLG